MGDVTPPVVADIGSNQCKVGFAGDDTPRVVFPSKIGKPRSSIPQHLLEKISLKDNYVGGEAMAKRGVLTLTYPIERGIVNNWEDVETIVHYIFNTQLCVDPGSQALLLTEPPFNPKPNRERMAQMAFETFGIPSLLMAIPGMLSLHAMGRNTGIVVDSGFDTTHVLPFHDGALVSAAADQVNVAGSELTIHLMRLLIEHSDVNYYEANDMKKLCSVAHNYEAEVESCPKKTYQLVNEEVLQLDRELLMCPEALFKPSIIGTGIESPGIHELTYNAVMKCEEEVRKDMLANIVLCGGSTSFPGITGRMQTEIASLTPASTEVSVTSPADAQNGAWIGGSRYAATPNFSQKCITKHEYEEFGSSIVHTKCEAQFTD